MRSLKKALTFEEQLEHLQTAHGLQIDDRAQAISILSQVNYYRLSGYGIGLMKHADPEKYAEGVTLRHLYRLYQFDTRFRGELFHLIEQTEIELRTQISYQLSTRYGSDGHYFTANFNDRATSHDPSVHAVIMGKFEQEIKRQSNLPCVRHHVREYGGRFPTWAAVELFTFGMLSSTFSIMKQDAQSAVARNFGVSSLHLESWIKALVEVRNRCAHYGRIYNMPLSQSPYLFAEHKQYRQRVNKIFPVLIVLCRMMQGRPAWTSFFETLQALIEEYPEVQLEFMGFPENWIDVLSEIKMK